MQSIIVPTAGTDSGPPSTEAYKRAIYKQPPRNFTVQVLPPQKHGNAYSYGMLITPTGDADRRSVYSGRSSDSGSSGGYGHGHMSLSHTSPVSPTFSSTSTPSTLTFPSADETTAPLSAPYEVWRRWEDCLFFQETLEGAYARMAREKRARLAAGKGVKRRGVYARDERDPRVRLARAASFESLPPGPDPALIAKDVHAPGLLPRLSKKGTLFRASRETVEGRAGEFEGMMGALLREDGEGEGGEGRVPMLLRELRETRTVRDFFGVWRRDVDRVAKQAAEAERAAGGGRRSALSVASRASSIFSGHIGNMGGGGSGTGSGSGIYFSPSNISLQLPSPDAHEAQEGPRGPRKPAFMQGVSSLVPPPLSPASPFSTTSTTASSTSNDTGTTSGTTGSKTRPRAHTMENPSPPPPPAGAAAYAARGGSLDIPGRGGAGRLAPASAPAGASFGVASRSHSVAAAAAAGMGGIGAGGGVGERREGGEGSDEGESDGSGAGGSYNNGFNSNNSSNNSGGSSNSSSPYSSPRRAPPAKTTTPENANAKARESAHGPIIVSLHEGETIALFGDDASGVGAGAAGYEFGLGGVGVGREGRAGGGGGRGVRDLTIREEEEEEEEDESETETETEGEGLTASSSPVPKGRGGRRTAGFSARPDGFELEVDARSVATADSGGSSGGGGGGVGGGSGGAGRGEGRMGARTPLSSARAAAAHADALRALTGGRSTSPSPSPSPTRNGGRERESVATFATGASVEEEEEGFEFRLSGIIQPPFVADEDDDDEEEDDDAAMYSRMNGFEDDDEGEAREEKRQRERHESMASVKTFMTTDSADAVVPLQLRAPVRRDRDRDQDSHRRSPLALGTSLGKGAGIPRPASADSVVTTQRMSLDGGDGGDIFDQYFSVGVGMRAPHGYGCADPDANNFDADDHDHLRDSLPPLPAQTQNQNPRPTAHAQIHLPRRPPTLVPESVSVSARASVLSTDSTDTAFSVPPPTPLLSEAARRARHYVEHGPLPSPASVSAYSESASESAYSESVGSGGEVRSAGTDGSFSISVLSPSAALDGSGSPVSTSTQEQEEQLPVKVHWRDTIVAFRVDRGASLAALRDKVRAKLASFADEEARPGGCEDGGLPGGFVLGYKAPAAGRLQALRGVVGVAGRKRSSSLSSLGSGAGPGAETMRVVAGEREWVEAVRACAPGAKLILYVLEG